jgi:hypothetical protein
MTMDDLRNDAEAGQVGSQGGEGSPQSVANDRTYIVRLDFLTLMDLLRWEVSDAAVVTTTLGEERVRIGTVAVPVLEQFTELLRRHFTAVTTVEARCPE